MNKSIRAISEPQFINLQPLEISPLISECEIKVMYIGKNVNGTYFTKEAATSMSKTLRGCPIVGHFIESKEDFHKHGKEIDILDNSELVLKDNTRPYGFVSPTADIWYQTFEEEDRRTGDIVTREYLMTKGYLWTGQYPEANLAIEGRPQSMELDERDIKGDWTVDSQGYEFFIVNDATFLNLCILGEDIEPAFETASIYAPSNSFSEGGEFATFYTNMMKELQTTLKGGKVMEENEKIVSENLEETQDKNIQNEYDENQETIEETTIVEDEPVEKEEEEPAPAEEAPVVEEEEESAPVPAEKTYSEAEYEELNSKYTAILEEVETLRAFKADIDSKEKDAVIAKFTKLTDAEKKEVIDNKDSLSLEEIQGKLSVIFTEKFMTVEAVADEPSAPIVTYDVSNSKRETLPEWILAVKNEENDLN